jgi:hypothetical protein
MVVTDRRLTTLIAVVVFFLLSISAATRPVAAMYRDFGTMPPTLARWVFTGWVPLVLGAVPVVVVAYTLVATSLDETRRRQLLWGALAFAAFALLTCMYALQLPKVPIMAR